MRAILWFPLVAACAVSTQTEVGIGSGGSGKADGEGSGSSAFVPAHHAVMPKVGTMGGPVIASPRVVPIFFANDPAQPAYEAMLAGIAGSSYWTANTQEYGVGQLALDKSIVVTDPPPTEQSALETWLAGKFPTFDASTIYTVFLPDGISFTSFGSASCTGWTAYHEEMTNGMIYALVPRCPTTTGVALDTEMIGGSHELVEAATDPHVNTKPAYNVPDPTYPYWAWGYSEVGDMCAYVPAANAKLIGSYVVQRNWSNAAAAAGHDPCVPELPGASIAAAPTVAQIAVPMGQTQTVEVDLFSDAPADDWTVRVSPMSSTAGNFKLAWDKTTGHNGDQLHLTITRTAATGATGVDMLAIESVRGDLGMAQWWLQVTQ